MKDKVIKFLNSLNIEYECVEHEPAYTMADLADFDENYKISYCKNLFLRNSNGKQHYLCVVYGEKKVDLKNLAKIIGSSRLSFGSEKRLMDNLKLEKGHVGPFGLLNDENKNVILVLDKEIKDKDRLAFHPNVNNASIILSYKSLIECMDRLEANIIYVDILNVAD